LSGKIEVLYLLGLKGVVKLGGWKIVVLDGIARFENFSILKARDCMQGIYLHLQRQGG
jgi:hypothetical protein